VAVQRTLDPDRVFQLQAASSVLAVSANPDIHSATVEKFRGLPDSYSGNYLTFSTGHPLTKAALVYLNEIWPRALPFPELLTAARARLNLTAPDSATDLDEARTLATNLLACYVQQLVSLHAHPFPCATVISERPAASPLARWQAQTDVVVTNLRHETITLDDHFSDHLLRYLDGTRDRAALAEVMTSLVAAGAVTVPEGQTLAATIDRNLLRTLRGALLIA
jgi:methyltransferase-like protein